MAGTVPNTHYTCPVAVGYSHVLCFRTFAGANIVVFTPPLHQNTALHCISNNFTELQDTLLLVHT